MSSIISAQSLVSHIDSNFSIIKSGIIVLSVASLYVLYLYVDHDKRGHVLAPKHNHHMDHNHTEDSPDGIVGRWATSPPHYLSGVGGWY